MGEQLVLRLQHRLTDEQVQCLNDEFGVMVVSGGMKQCGPLEGEDDHLDLPRLVFHHTRRQFGLLRALIHRINGFAGPDAPASAKVGEAGDTGVA